METYLIPCLLGLEKLVSDEVKRLGLQEVQAENGRILCRGTLADAARLNLNLRCGARVLLVLGRFPARSFEELFQGTHAIAWEDYLPENAAFPVKGYSISSQLHSVPACQSIIKKAMVERMKAHYHREQFPEDGVKYQVRFSLFKDEAALCLDTSGEGLYKRGYRAVGVEAPLRETLAAAMVLLSRYRGKDPLCDPFCGSGTIPIEAALIAKNRAPGLDRSFDAQRWAFLPAKVWMDAADEAMDKEFHGHYDIWGGDVDPRAVAIARDNAMCHDLMRSLKKKPFFQMESCPSSTNWQGISKLKKPGILFAQSMQPIAHGGEGALHFHHGKTPGRIPQSGNSFLSGGSGRRTGNPYLP